MDPYSYMIDHNTCVTHEHEHFCNPKNPAPEFEVPVMKQL